MITRNNAACGAFKQRTRRRQCSYEELAAGSVPNKIYMYKRHKQYRLKGYDYSNSGHYFITIVTDKRRYYFGKIENEKFYGSQIGCFLDENLRKYRMIENENPYIENPYFIQDKGFIIAIDTYAIMPDHVHLLIELLNPNKTENNPVLGLSPLKKDSVSLFVNQMKGVVQKYANKNELEFKWQARFHDRIVRDDKEYYNIKNYIDDNVKNWKKS